MGYFFPASPQGWVLRSLVDVDWDEHFTPRQLQAISAAGLFLDYQLVAGFLRLGGVALPFAAPRAAIASSVSWGSFLMNPYVSVATLGLVGHTHAIRTVQQNQNLGPAEKTSWLRSISQALVGTGPGVGSWTY